MSVEQAELLNVPLYAQGHYDGLCTYYSTAMMLAALYPSFARDFGQMNRRRGGRRGSARRGGRVTDPIIRHYPRRTRTDRDILAEWFYEGEYLSRACEILNRIMLEEGHATWFEYERKTARDGTFERISNSIDEGLPVMLGWSTEDFGDHAVLVTGYWHGKKDWFLLNDPGGDTEVCWQNLQEDKKSNFEVVTCNSGSHQGPRPDKVVSKRGGETIFRWTPKREYVPIDEYFASEEDG